MSEIEQTETTTNETTNEATDEVKEIEIPIEEKKQEVSVVKDISKLTLEERAKIITDARNGIPNEHYDVILLKNGNTRIVKKKNKTPTQSVASRLISQTQNNQTPTPNKIYMSDTQIMMEHIIELNNQVNKLMTKQKKLKKKYKTLKYDIYEDVDENQITQEPKQEQKNRNQHRNQLKRQNKTLHKIQLKILNQVIVRLALEYYHKKAGDHIYRICKFIFILNGS